MRESRTYGSVRGARDEIRVPTATEIAVNRLVVHIAHEGNRSSRVERNCLAILGAP
jgi:hypothetical protein